MHQKSLESDSSMGKKIDQGKADPPLEWWGKGLQVYVGVI